MICSLTRGLLPYLPHSSVRPLPLNIRTLLPPSSHPSCSLFAIASPCAYLSFPFSSSFLQTYPSSLCSPSLRASFKRVPVVVQCFLHPAVSQNSCHQNSKSASCPPTMARSENCLHCADLWEELEQIRAHQKLLDAKIDSHARITSEKYEVDLNLFLHRVSSLQEQFNDLSNKCSHKQESIDILKYMMEKRNAPNTSSSNLRDAKGDSKPEESTARQISHINID